MATTQTFGGGVHPREIGNGKNATQSQHIVNAAAPARVTIASKVLKLMGKWGTIEEKRKPERSFFDERYRKEASPQA